MRRIAAFGAGAVVVAVLASGCGGAPDASMSATSVQASAASSEGLVCEGTPRPGVALDPAATACADNGFEPQADVFAFANWGGSGSLDATGMVAMFGPESVCAQRSGGACVLFPAARAWLDQVNEAMSGGRCEGMAVVAARLEDGGAPVSALQNGAQVTADLKQETRPVVDEIEYWWATQMVEEVAGPTAQVRAMQPAEVVASLVEGLRAGTGYTLGMYANGAGHAVTPFAVSKSPDGSLDIAIYDNNFPGVVSHVIVDPSNQTWTYDQATINPSADAAVWTGTGPGTLDLTAMDWRTGPFAAPFADAAGDSAKGEVSRTFLVTAGIAPGEGAVGAEVSAGGITIDTTTGLAGVDALPPGVVVTPIKAQTQGQGTVVGVQVTAPASVGSITVSPRVVQFPGAQSGSAQSGSAKSGGIRARVSVDAPGQPRVTAIGAASDADAAFSITTGASGATQVVASTGARVLMSVASGRQSLTIPVPPGGQISIIEGENEIAEIVLEAEDGTEVELTLDGGTEGDVEEFVATFEDGEWVFEEWSDEAAAPWEDENWYSDETSSDPWSEDAWSGDLPSDANDALSGGDASVDSSSGADSEDSSWSDDSGGGDSGGGDSGGGDSGGGDSGGGDSGGGDSGGGDSGGGDSGGGDSGGEEE